MKLLCRLGIHRWEYRDARSLDCVDTLTRCRRNGCTRYPRWRNVNCSSLERQQTTDSRKASA